MANEWAEESLPTGTDGKTRPAIWDDAKEEWIVPKGRDGRQWVRDDGLDKRLKSIEEQNEKILKRLDGTFDTQVTGSIVEDGDAVPTRKKSVESEKMSNFIVLAGTEKICFSDYSPDIDEILFGCFAKNGHDYTLRTIEKPMAYDGSLYNETLIYSEGSREAVIERKFVNFHRITSRLRNRDTEDQEYRVAFRQIWRR